MTDLTHLRAATEDDVTRALDGAFVKIDAPAADLLEFFNRMLDVMTGLAGYHPNADDA